MISSRIFFIFSMVCSLAMASCTGNKTDSPARGALTVQTDLSGMLENISADIAKDGPGAWIKYFDSSAHFFMANNGALAFKDFASGKKFVNDTLVGMVQHLELTFHDIRIDSLSPAVASIGAGYHEDSKDVQGNSHSYDGYFTATAILTSRGWKLRNLHWSE